MFTSILSLVASLMLTQAPPGQRRMFGPHHGATGKDLAIAGLLKHQTFVEVKVIDATQAPAVTAQKLQAALKEFAARK